MKRRARKPLFANRCQAAGCHGFAAGNNPFCLSCFLRLPRTLRFDLDYHYKTMLQRQAADDWAQARRHGDAWRAKIEEAKNLLAASPFSSAGTAARNSGS